MDVGQDKLEQIESLLSQSTQGIHLLFDHQAVAKILKTPTENLDFFSMENVKKVQKILSEFIAMDSFHKKRAYISDLNPETYELLVRTYFNIVENAVLESSEFKH